MSGTRRMYGFGRICGLLIAATIGVAGCNEPAPTGLGPDDGGGGAVRGDLVLAVSGGSTGSAFLVEVSGPGIDGVKSVVQGKTYSTIEGSQLSLAVMGQPDGGRLALVTVPDVNRYAEYSVSLLEVADSNNDLLSPGAFQLQITR
jgi:hypothetical protein